MVDKVRKFLIFLTLGIVGMACYHLFFKNQEPVEKVVMKKLDAGVDIEIENFEVVHEVNEGKKWELKADLAQVDLEKDLTRLTNVDLKIKDGDKQEFWVVADSGSIQNNSKDIELDGNVKMVSASNVVENRVGQDQTDPDQ